MFESVLDISRVRIYQGSKDVRVLNIPFRKYKKVLFPENLGAFWRKYKKVFQSSFFLVKFLRAEA